MDFRDFANNYKQKKDSTQKNDTNASTNNNSDYEDMIKKYENLNQQELMSELFKQSEQMKSEGRWNNEEMEKIASTLSPYLNDEQKQMLASLTKRLNND